MLAHDDVWNAIDTLAHRNGLSPSGLARRAGLDPTTFNKSKRFAPDGRPRWPSTESISKILRATNTSVSDLFGLTGGVDVISVPLVGTAHAGFETVPAEKSTAPAPLPPRVIAFPDKRHDPLYALTVVGDSMLPLYRDGDILFMSRTAEPRVGDRVVVKLRDTEPVVKVLAAATPEGYAFHAINPDHADVAFAPEDIEWVARILYATQ